MVAFIPKLLAIWDGMCNVEVILKPGSKPAMPPDDDDESARRTLIHLFGDMSVNHYVGGEDSDNMTSIYNYTAKSGEGGVTIAKMSDVEHYKQHRVMTTTMATMIALRYSLITTATHVFTFLCTNWTAAADV